MKHRYFLLAILFSVFLVGCAAPPPKPLSEYIPVDFKKLVTPMFIDDYVGKYVKVSCKFYFTSRVPEGLKDTEYFSFMASSPDEQSPDDLTVIGPKRIADTYLSLRSGDQIIVYGKVHQMTTINVAGAKYRRVALQAYAIEKK